jgi:hypothetical protein
MTRRETTGFSRGRYATRCVSTLAFLLLFALAAFGQDGSITGNITDPQGAATPNASIDAKNADTGTVFHGGTSGSGNYVINVPAGKYELTITASGFKKYVRANLEVVTASATRQDVRLELGALTDTITITDEAPLLKTESGEISHEIATDDVNQLPLLTTTGGFDGAVGAFGNIRNPLQEILLLPGTNFSNDTAIVVNGLPANSENIRIEGQDSTSTIWKIAQQNSQGGVDAIQEVAIQTSNFAPEYGQAAGGYFNYTMKSGTNLFHGSGYDYLANEALNAGEPFTDAGLTNSLKDGQHIRNAARRNDYGFTIGGPIRIPKLYDGRNRTFFFVNFEQFRQNNTTSGTLATVPITAWQGSPTTGANFSLAECGGTTNGACTPFAFPSGPVLSSATFTQVHDTLGQGLVYGEIFDPKSTMIVGGAQVRTPFPNNTIPYSQLDRVSLAIAALMPAPNTGATGTTINNYTIPTYTGYQHTTNLSVKFDQALSSTMKLSGYYSQLSTQNYNGFSSSHLALGGATPTNNWNHTTRVNFDWTITPTLLYHAGIGFFDTSEPNIPPQQNQSTIGLTGYYDPTRFPSIGGIDSFFSGGWGPGFGAVGPSFTAYIWEQKPTATQSLTWIRGNHTFKAGGEYVGEGFPEQSLWRANGSFGFSSAETADPYQNTVPLLYGAATATGTPYASFMLGLPDNLSLNPQTAVRLGDHSLGFYLQDSWKVTHKLTIDYGLRYDYETYMKEQYGRMQDASFTTPNANAGGLNGAVVYEGTCKCSFSHNYPYAWGPRIGAAYQIDSKTVLRGGGGVQYDATEAPNGIVYSTADYYTLNPTSYGISPLTNTGGLAGGNPFAVGNPYGNAPITWPNFNSSKYPIANGGLYTPLSPFIFFDPSNRPARIFTWSIGVQREVIKNLLVEVSYVGNRGAYFTAPWADQMTENALTPAGLLANDGLDITSTVANNCPKGVAAGSPGCYTDAQLLLQPLTSSIVQARFPKFANQVLVNGVATTPGVYPGFPSSQQLVQALRPVPQWAGGVNPWLGPPLGDTWYDSMQVKVTKRYSHGLQAQGNFTWAKGLVDGASSDSTYFLGSQPAVNDVYNFGQNKQLNQYVRPLALTITGTYTTPKFSAAGTGMRILSQVARDWQIGAVLRYQSGALIQVPSSNNSLGAELGRNLPASGTTSTYQNVVAGQNPLLVDPNCGCFNPQTAQVLNPAAWVDAAPGQWGTSAPYYNNYRWQRQPAESMSFARNFRVGKEGKYSLQLRIEFQNIFNRLSLSAPTATNPSLGLSASNGVNTGGFGSVATVNGAGDAPRSGQAVMRFTF